MTGACVILAMIFTLGLSQPVKVLLFIVVAIYFFITFYIDKLLISHDVYEELTQTKVEWEWYKHVEDRKGHDYRYAINNWELKQEFPDFKLSNFRQSLKDTVQSYL